jgi:hypothetical protein
MTRLRGEPVRHTCPDIDSIISTITIIVNQMNSVDESSEINYLIEDISNWANDLKIIAVGSRSEMENLRSSNSALRDWGNEMHQAAQDLEFELDAAEFEISNLKKTIEELRIINSIPD